MHIKTIDNKIVWFLESRAWKTIVSVDHLRKIVAFVKDKNEWERFYPEEIVKSEPLITEKVSLKTFLGTYLCASSSSSIDAAPTVKALCSN